MLRRDLQRLALARVTDARVLFAAGRYDAAYYLAGLAVECALKARIARATARYEFRTGDLPRERSRTI
jgi:HEPN domain-containing protein